MSKVDKSKFAPANPPARLHRRKKKGMDSLRVRLTIGEIFGETEHALRVESLANAVQGITMAAVLSIHAIGQAYAQLAGITGKSGVKQIDRLLSSANFVIEKALQSWIKFVVGARTEIVLALDWTDFDGDGQTTLAAYVVSNHGRATLLA